MEAELKKLEHEEFQRQKDNVLFREKLRQTRHSLDNICDADGYNSNYTDRTAYRKSMPDLDHVLLEYHKPDTKYEYGKSMPDIQCAYNRSVLEYCNNAPSANPRPAFDYRKSMPELQRKPELSSPPPNWQPIKPQRFVK